VCDEERPLSLVARGGTPASRAAGCFCQATAGVLASSDTVRGVCNVDQPILTLTREQVRFVGLYVAGVDGAASVDIYDLGGGDFQLEVFDKTGERIATETMRGHDLTLP
jgi:hypothetical protein